MKKLHVGCSPLTGIIYAGHVLKDGMTWASNRQDVTVEALAAVAQHVEDFGRPVELRRKNGDLEYTITVKRHELHSS